MENQKGSYRQGGWFLFAVTIVALVLANALHATMPVLIIIGVVGFVCGLALIIMAERRPK